MRTLSACIQGVGPPRARAARLARRPARCSAASAPYVAAPTVLPPPESCRRPSGAAPAASSGWRSRAGHEAVRARRRRCRARCRRVFTSSGGDGENCHEICWRSRPPSARSPPPAFTTRCTTRPRATGASPPAAPQPPTRCAPHDASFAAGLLEALTQLAGGARGGAAARLRRRLPAAAAREAADPGCLRHRAAADAGAGTAAALPRLALHTERRAARRRCRMRRSRPCAASIPAARSLPLLQHLAQRRRAPWCSSTWTRTLARRGDAVKLDHAWIEPHIPHKGRMCLLDDVLSWDRSRIRCRSAQHRTPDNPLRAHGRLGAACGIEYAAQAMAVHGALLRSAPPASRQPASACSTSARRLSRGRSGSTICAPDDLTVNVQSPAQRCASARCTRSRCSDGERADRAGAPEPAARGGRQPQAGRRRTARPGLIAHERACAARSSPAAAAASARRSAGAWRALGTTSTCMPTARASSPTPWCESCSARGLSAETLLLRRHRRRRHARGPRGGARERARSRSWSTTRAFMMMRCCRA